MHKILLTGLLVSGALTALAAAPVASTTAVVPADQVFETAAPATKAYIRAAQHVQAGDGQVRFYTVDGKAVKKIAVPNINKSVNPTAKQVRRGKDADNGGVLLYESFENPDEENTSWLPEGWTQVSYTEEELYDGSHWHADISDGMFLPVAPDGDWMAAVYFDMNNFAAAMDEWLISPEVTIPETGVYDLSFWAYVSPIFNFNLDNDHLDWDTFEFIEQEVVYTLEVLISADGGEYEEIFDLTDQFMGESAEDLMMIDEMRPFTIRLADYAGKKIKIAFRMVGHDCNSQFIDAVKIAMPQMELEIMPDFGIQYFGTSEDALFASLTTGVAFFPVYTPFTFENYSYNEGASYTWHYTDPTTYDWTTADGDETLSLTYVPDYTEDFAKVNNLVYPPYLTATGEGYADSELKLPDLSFMQVGGTPCWPSEGSYIPFGTVPFNVWNCKVGGYSVVYDATGDAEVPIFGHNASTTQWWTDYTFQGEPEEGDVAEVNAILNFIYTVPGAKMVVDKAWVHAFGTFESDVEFTCGIYPVDPETFEPGEEAVATATITGADALISPQGTKNLVSLVFSFDQPVVLDGDAGYYMVKVSGFNSDKVEFFQPFQQWRPGQLALGWIEKNITWAGESRRSFSPIAYFENDYGDMYCAFDIELGAWYPWLKSDAEGADLGDGCEATIALATYYDGADLTITAPEWIEATAAGRYDECAVSVKAAATDEAREGEITVAAPGVESLTFKVSQGVTSGISSIAAGANRTVKSAVTPAGVAADMSAPGIYIVTYTDGSVEKKVVK